jgi:hypothetical protein
MRDLLQRERDRQVADDATKALARYQDVSKQIAAQFCAAESRYLQRIRALEVDNAQLRVQLEIMSGKQ